MHRQTNPKTLVAFLLVSSSSGDAIVERAVVPDEVDEEDVILNRFSFLSLSFHRRAANEQTSKRESLYVRARVGNLKKRKGEKF